MPLVTVFTPVFNLEKYIEETINSILSQTFTDYEIILVDNTSSDDSVSFVNLVEYNIGIKASCMFFHALH